jgi:hypothetical protein
MMGIKGEKMFNVELMLVVALVIGFIIYKEISKVTSNIDIHEQNPDMSKYSKFCDFIDDEITSVKNSLMLENIKLKNEDLKDEFLDKVSTLSKELVFLQNMSSSNKNANDWEKRLFDFLNKFESLNDEYLQNSQNLNDEIRERLANKFRNL